jgi:hypothetical protein
MATLCDQWIEQCEDLLADATRDMFRGELVNALALAEQAAEMADGFQDKSFQAHALAVAGMIRSQWPTLDLEA